MTQKQMVSVFVGLVLIMLLGVFVYVQFVNNDQSQSQGDTMKPGNTMMQSNSRMMKKESTPESIDAITESIFVESSADTSALDAEADGEAAELDEDNESVNNLENSYDENNL